MSGAHDRAPPERPDSDGDSDPVEERLNVTPVDPDAEAASVEEPEVETADNPMVDGFQQVDPPEAEADDTVETEVPHAADDEGRDLSRLTEEEADELGEIVDWQYTDGTEDWVVLQTHEEQVLRAAQPPEVTVRDWAALIRAGAAEFDDVAARPYQDWTDEEMRERVDAELRGGD